MITRTVRAQLTSRLLPGESLRLGMGAARHVGGLARARGVSRAHDRRWEVVLAREKRDGLRGGCRGALGWACRDLLVEGRASEVAVGHL